MNPFAYSTTGLAVKLLSALSRARVNLHGEQNIPHGAIIFVINHFTRMETLLLPANIYRITGVPVWSLADYALFEGPLGNYLNAVGAVSTRDPERDELIVKTLLTAEASWVIYPEGCMVKDKKLLERGRFMVSSAEGRHPPHTGAATLALRTEFYRRRIRAMLRTNPEEAQRLVALFGLQPDDLERVLTVETFIVPVNVTYFPIRARENVLTILAQRFSDDLSPRAMEELMTEGTMLISGVDVDMRFGRPLRAGDYLCDDPICSDIASGERFDFDDEIPSLPDLRREAWRLMQRYMSDIYRMTTVNSDHLLAALIEMSPSRRIALADLRRRLFLAATEAFEGLDLNRHASLEHKQTHLLTDDRFGRFHDFVALLAERGIVELRNAALLRRDMDRIRNWDFHRIRVENPMAVIANEIEPLTRLQHRLKRLARLSPRLVRKQLVLWLETAIQKEYDRDYSEFYVPGESKPKAVGRPIMVRGFRRRTGILLLHGYLASPPEMAELARFLGKKGFTVYVARIKGHGTSPDDLALRSRTDWIESAEEGYIILRNTCRQVVAGGFSNGATLALDLASRVDDMAGVFAVSPPLKLQDFAARFAPAIDTWNRLLEKMHIEEARREFVDNSPENPHINYHRNPVAGIRELEQLAGDVEKKLPQITVPALLVQSHRDPVVDERGARRIFEQLGSEDKRYLVVNFDRHGILLGPGAGIVHQAIYDFVRRL